MNTLKITIDYDKAAGGIVGRSRSRIKENVFEANDSLRPMSVNEPEPMTPLSPLTPFPGGMMMRQVTPDEQDSVCEAVVLSLGLPEVSDEKNLDEISCAWLRLRNSGHILARGPKAEVKFHQREILPTWTPEIWPPSSEDIENVELFQEFFSKLKMPLEDVFSEIASHSYGLTLFLLRNRIGLLCSKEDISTSTRAGGQVWPAGIPTADILFAALTHVLKISGCPSTSTITKEKFSQLQNMIDAERSINKFIARSGINAEISLAATGGRLSAVVAAAQHLYGSGVPNMAPELLDCLEQLHELEPKASANQFILDVNGSLFGSVIDIVLRQGTTGIENETVVRLWNIISKIITDAMKFGCPIENKDNGSPSARLQRTDSRSRTWSKAHSDTSSAVGKSDPGTPEEMSESRRRRSETMNSSREAKQDADARRRSWCGQVILSARASPPNSTRGSRKPSKSNTEMNESDGPPEFAGGSRKPSKNNLDKQGSRNSQKSNGSGSPDADRGHVLPVLTKSESAPSICTKSLMVPEPRRGSKERSTSESKSSQPSLPDLGTTPMRRQLSSSSTGSKSDTGPSPRAALIRSRDVSPRPSDDTSQNGAAVSSLRRSLSCALADAARLSRSTSNEIKDQKDVKEAQKDWEVTCCNMLWNILPPQAITYAIGVGMHSVRNHDCLTKLLRASWSLFEQGRAVECMCGDIGIMRLRMQMDMLADQFARCPSYDKDSDKTKLAQFFEKTKLTLVHISSMCESEPRFAQVAVLFGVAFITDSMCSWADSMDDGEALSAAGRSLATTLRPHVTQLFQQQGFAEEPEEEPGVHRRSASKSSTRSMCEAGLQELLDDCA
jgi:hypothetical protein